MEITTFDSVFDAITTNPHEAQKLKMRAELMSMLIKEIESWGIIQEEAASRLGIMQPRLNRLLKGRMGDFSLDSLIDLTLKAGLNVTLDIRRAA
jgi:predicted XRE-type DNA-binding protein